jgi:hypothetical protein
MFSTIKASCYLLITIVFFALMSFNTSAYLPLSHEIFDQEDNVSKTRTDREPFSYTVTDKSASYLDLTYYKHNFDLEQMNLSFEIHFKSTPNLENTTVDVQIRTNANPEFLSDPDNYDLANDMSIEITTYDHQPYNATVIYYGLYNETTGVYENWQTFTYSISDNKMSATMLIPEDFDLQTFLDNEFWFISIRSSTVGEDGIYAWSNFMFDANYDTGIETTSNFLHFHDLWIVLLSITFALIWLGRPRIMK